MIESIEPEICQSLDGEEPEGREDLHPRRDQADPVAGTSDSVDDSFAEGANFTCSLRHALHPGK